MENSVVDINEQSKKFNTRTAAGAAAAGGLIAVSLADPASAQETNATATADITAMVTGLGVLAGAALAVALVPAGINYALKIIQRVMSRA